MYNIIWHEPADLKKSTKNEFISVSYEAQKFDNEDY